MEYGFKKYEPKPLVKNHLKLGGTSKDGGSIEVSNKYFIKDNKPCIWVMGEYHFSRDSRENWYEELSKMRAGGITLVSTYIIWIYHEETEGSISFEGDLDIRSFILDCKRAGLDVIIRIGPWCHGEVRNGGLPDWILKKPFPVRCNDPGYLEYAKKWYSAISDEVKGLFYKDGGPIVGVQIENELTEDAEHLLRLKELALKVGMDAPLYTVTGWNSAAGARIPVDEVVPVFGGYCDAPWEASIKELMPSSHYVFNQMRNDSAIGKDQISQIADDGWQLPYENYPFATCELGGGLHGTHHRRYIINGMDIYALSLVKLGVGNNLIGYYMYHGGTNKIGKYSTLQECTLTGYPNDYPILSYDFQAPISQFGEIREQYRLLNLIHMFVNDFGDIIAPMEAVDSKCEVSANDTKSLRYGMRTDGKGGFVFINHYQRLRSLEDNRSVIIDTGIVKFPKIDVCGDISFFMPFNMDINGHNLEYATAQPLCKVGDKYFFVEIPGIKACYKISDDGLKDIITLSFDEARFARKLDNKLYIGNGCDLYFDGADILSVENLPYSYKLFNGTDFDEISVNLPYDKPQIKVYDCEKPGFDIPYAYELNYGGGRKAYWKKVEVSGAQGFVEIDVPLCDVMQMYADGELVADEFYYGKPWRLPASMLNKKECYLAYSDYRPDNYKEF